MTTAPLDHRGDDIPLDRAPPGPVVPARAIVVFVPGLGLDAAAWDAVRRELPGESRVVLLPSMGEPATRGTDVTVERQAARVLTAFPDGKAVILVGHSASCPVVVEAAAHSHNVIGLVLVGPVTDPESRSWPAMLSQWLRVATHEPPRLSVTLLPQYVRTGAVGMLRGMNIIRHFRTDLALGQLTMIPVEIIRGERDRIAPRDWCAELRQASGGRLTSVAGGAHMVPLTHPGVIVEAVQRIHAHSVRSGRGGTGG